MPTSKKSPLSRPFFWLGAGAFVLVALGVVLFWVVVFAAQDRPTDPVTIKAGETYQSVLLHQQGNLERLMLRLYLKVRSPAPLQAGVYSIPKGVSVKEMVDILEQGADVAMIKIQIIEGKTIKDLYQTLKSTQGVTLELLTPRADGYSWVDVARDNKAVAHALGIDPPLGNLEGQFAPDTYFFDKGTSDAVILRRLHQHQKTLLDKAWQDRATNLPYQNPYEALIMASIIEKETGIVSERADVAAVFVNRLKQGMRLQTDPTIIYGLFDRYDGAIYRSNIQEKTAYNTYQINGLPPTPIALPSAAAIHAALHPSDVPYVYFVATGKGGHTFSTTLLDHNKAVAKYRAIQATDKEKP